MILKDLLIKDKPIQIMYRCNTPFPDIDTLFGYCFWNGETLESLDGDSYYLDDEIEKYIQTIVGVGVDFVFDAVFGLHIYEGWLLLYGCEYSRCGKDLQRGIFPQ